MRATGRLALGFIVGAIGCAQVEAASSVDDIEATSVQKAALSRAHGDDDNGRHGGRETWRCPRDVPPALSPPSDATLALAMRASGVQIYACATPTAGGAPAWTLKAPHANLTETGAGDDDQPSAVHFAGPSWQALDGSLVTGTRAASAAAPEATAIPWLLLRAASNVGEGRFHDVTWIQRLETTGGVSPSVGCDIDHVGAQVLVPYRATYFFYRAAATGESPRQCVAR